MVAITVPAILAAMAAKIATVDGVNAAHYPPPKTIMRGPEVVLYWGSDVDTVIANDMRERRMWTPAVKAQILIAAEGNTPAEFGVIDGLIHPIVDLFDAGTTSQVMPTLGGKVDRCQVERVRPTLMVNYGGTDFYAAELFFTIKFHRNVEVTP